LDIDYPKAFETFIGYLTRNAGILLLFETEEPGNAD
jgi:hypothetical protein